MKIKNGLYFLKIERLYLSKSTVLYKFYRTYNLPRNVYVQLE